MIRKAVRSGSFGQPQMERACRIYMQKGCDAPVPPKTAKARKVPPKDMLLMYTACIRPLLEYACPVFHHSLPQYLSNEMERLQKRALRIIQLYAEAQVALDVT